MMNNRHEKPLMIFHHPGPVYEGGRTGSQVRPWRMLQAFHEAGYEVISVVGFGKERKGQINNVKRVLNEGHRIRFLYSEARSIPTLLTEPHRLPNFPVMDFRFMRRMRKLGIPVGLFYRDVFWRFKMYRTQLAVMGRVITIPLYHYDWWWYQRVVDHLFLPSLPMANHLPDRWPASRLSALPPGVSASHDSETKLPRRGGIATPRLRLLYVGGVHPPNYDLTWLFEVIKQAPGIELTLCCREDEWQAYRKHYLFADKSRIKIVHLSGKELDSLYSEADLVAILWKPHEYVDFAAPVKLFEAAGHGVPIVTFEGTETARIVRKNNWGWVSQDKDDMVNLLNGFIDDPTAIDEKRNVLLESRRDHTWLARAREAATRIREHDLR